jgi:class 3 adenylate cyclase
MPEDFVKFNKKKFSTKVFLMKFLILIILIGIIYFLFMFGVLKYEHFQNIEKIYTKTSRIISSPENSGKFILIFLIFVLSNVFLTFFLLSKKNGSSSLEVKTTYAKKVKELETNISGIREEMNNRKIKFSSVLLRYRELLSSLEKDKITSIIFNILEKSVGAKKVSLFLIDVHKDEIFMLNRFGGPVDKTIKLGIEDKNIISYAISQGKFFSSWDEDNIIKNLIKTSPISVKTISPIFKEKVSGAIVIEEFFNEDFELDEESKLLITTTASLAAIAFDKASVFEMTADELQSEKQFSKKQIEEKKALRNSFQKYTSPAIVEQLIKNPDMLKLGGKKAELSVLFSDIVGFTTYSEKYPAEKVVSILNEYLTAMTDVIMDNYGTLDKFVGDEIMAVWGAPVPQNNHVELSVRCGFGMLKKLDELQEKWKKEGVEPFNIGIGINTGEMIVGNMGSPKRMDYTVIGDAVNTGARIEALTRQFKTSFIVSESTYIHVKDIVEAELLGKVSVKGKANQIKVYKLSKLIG